MALRILLGGIPLGCDNIGDEAILAGVVRMLRSIDGSFELTVATADPATGPLLGVKTVPLWGEDAIASCDVFIWCGATGLSDYPDRALDLVELAQRRGKATFVWGVGMDDELNPVYFKVHGKRRLALKLAGFGSDFFVRAYERRLERRLAARLSRVLARCRGIWLRDEPSRAKLLSLAPDLTVRVTADSALDFTNHQSPVTPHSALCTLHSTLGLCISTQRQVRDLAGLKSFIAAVRAAGYSIIGLAMNPKTDRALMESLGVECVAGSTPEAITEAASRCDLVLSSRLHLLILAANAGTPVRGIARGSKLANFLANFGLGVEGSVYDCDWRALASRVIADLANPGLKSSFAPVRAAAYRALSERFAASSAELASCLARLTYSRA